MMTGREIRRPGAGEMLEESGVKSRSSGLRSQVSGAGEMLEESDVRCQGQKEWLVKLGNFRGVRCQV